MRSRSNGWLRHLVLAALATAAVSSTAGTSLAYVVVTRDGHRIDVQARPEIRGLQAYMRLKPHGQLAVMQEDLIDWAGTESANPVASPIAVPSSTKMTEIPALPPGPIELKLIGTPATKEPAGEATETRQGSGMAGEGSAEQKRINAQEAVIKLQKEYVQVAAARDQEAAKKKGWEEELAQLQAREVGYASETSSTQQRIRELQQLIAESTSRIGQFEMRLGDIRSEVVQLGGTID